MSRDAPPKITKDGLLDGRGHGEGSKPTRFAPGDGRKRPGRPKGARDLRSIVQRIKQLQVEVGGKRRRKVGMQEGILLAQARKALAGDVRAAQYVLNQLERFETPVIDPDQIARLLQEDQDILFAAAARGAIRTEEPDGE